MTDRPAAADAADLQAGTHIPTASFRWFQRRPHRAPFNYDASYLPPVLQQRCLTTGGREFWVDVPTVTEPAHD